MKIATLLLALLTCFAAARGSVVDNPSVEFTLSGIQKVIRVEADGESTRVHMLNEFIPGWWICFDPATSLVDRASGKSYPIVDMRGGKIGERITTPSSGDTLVVLIFPPLDEGVRKVDFTDDTGKATIFGISLHEGGGMESPREVPADVMAWLGERTGGDEPRSAKSFAASDFLGHGTARVAGYINGYDPRAGFTTGIVHHNNNIANEEVPVLVRVEPDGRFEAEIPLVHPQTVNIWFDRYFVPVYLEQGSAVGVIVDWREFLAADRYRNTMYNFKDLRYTGPLARVNRELRSFSPQTTPYDELKRIFEQKGPMEGQRHLRAEMDANLAALEKLRPTLSEDSYRLLKMAETHRFAERTMDCISLATDEASLKIPAEYYDFLRELPLDDPGFLSPGNWVFINRFEFMRPLWFDSRHYDPASGETYEEAEMRHKDSVYTQVLGLAPSLLYDLTKVRKFGGREFAGEMGSALDMARMTSEAVRHPFLKDEVWRLFRTTLPSPADARAGKALPSGAGTDLFKGIVDRFKGKMVLVDFWATSCGPCIANIRETKENRARMEESGELTYVFITDESQSPQATYDKFVADQRLLNTFRVSADGWNMLQELFKFSGIPQYVLLSAEGLVLNEKISPYNLEMELEKYSGK